MRQQRWDPDGSWQETDLVDGWTVRETFAVQGGRRVVAELTIRPTSEAVPADGISARLLRRIKVGRFAEGLHRRLATYFGSRTADDVFDEFQWKPRKRRRSRPQHRRAADRYYAELARDYVRLWQAGDRTPTHTLARRRRMRDDQVRSHIHLARANGFLTDTRRGKAGGMMTAKARGELAKPRQTPR
jgi:hypothetical protein